MVINPNSTFTGVTVTGSQGSTEILGTGILTTDGNKLTLTTTPLTYAFS